MKEFGGKLCSIRGTPYPEGDWIENDDDKIRLGFSASSSYFVMHPKGIM
jgi:hypothetical protein